MLTSISSLRSTPTLLSYHPPFLRSTTTPTSTCVPPITSLFVNSFSRRARPRQERLQQLGVIDLELKCRSRRRKSRELDMVSNSASLNPSRLSSRENAMLILSRPSFPDLFNFASSDDPSQPLRMPRNQQEADEMMAATLRMAANRPQNLLEVRSILWPRTTRRTEPS